MGTAEKLSWTKTWVMPCHGASGHVSQMKDSSAGCAQFCNAIPRQEFFNGCKKGHPQSETNQVQIVEIIIVVSAMNWYALIRGKIKKLSSGWKTTDCVFCEYLYLFGAETRQHWDANCKSCHRYFLFGGHLIFIQKRKTSYAVRFI